MKKPISDTYSHCNFYNIDTLNINSKENQNISEKDMSEIRKQMIEYIQGITGFSQELIERVIETMQNYIKNLNGGNQDAS